MPPVSVLINTLNEEANLPECLQSARWASEIIVVDMHSVDGTERIARDFGCRVFQHERTGYVEPARNFAMAQAKNPWVLVLDADERVSPGLAEWIQAFDGSEAAAYRIPRRNFYGTYWVTDLQLRLLRRDLSRYPGGIHKAPEVNGNILNLPRRGDAYLAHLGFIDLQARFEKNNNYSGISAKQMDEAGKRVGALGLLTHPAGAFLRSYILQGGIRQGSLGVVLAWERAFENFSKYAKLWERQHGPSRSPPPPAHD